MPCGAKTLTFKGIDVVMNGVGSTPYGEWTWMTICASKDAVLALDNVNMTMDATGSTGSPHAIYFCSNNKLNLTNGSVLTIKNYPNDALEWDGGDGGYNVNITNSTFISDHNRSGFTGTFYATITNSKVDVVNSLGNGSNGSHFIIEDSEVNFNNNGSHGLSAGELSIDNSTVRKCQEKTERLFDFFSAPEKRRSFLVYPKHWSPPVFTIDKKINMLNERGRDASLVHSLIVTRSNCQQKRLSLLFYAEMRSDVSFHLHPFPSGLRFSSKGRRPVRSLPFPVRRKARAFCNLSRFRNPQSTQQLHCRYSV